MENYPSISYSSLLFFLLFRLHSICLISITLLYSHYYSHSIFHSSFFHHSVLILSSILLLIFILFLLYHFFYHSIPILFSILLSIFKLFILHRFFYYRSKNLVPHKSHEIRVNYRRVRKTLKVSER